MSKRWWNRLFLFGLLTPFAAVFLYLLVYSTLTSLSRNVERDWLIRLLLAGLAMVVPSLVTIVFTIREQRERSLTLPSKIGFAMAIASLGLLWQPLSDGILRWKQTKNMAAHDVAAPLFATVDISERGQRLENERGKVVLVNVWATWCEPCRNEMPKLDQLYRSRKNRGLVVFGLSGEDAATQKKFLTQVPVTYPLLTMSGEIPHFYRDIARYPANFLVDRLGRLQPAPDPNQPFAKVEAAVDALLDGGSE
ncbi:MAG TPA: redoxin domain-containing protein [Candidatus Saccharimonadales bacterium]|nr:redoxin domain-containing protein [Candidatus Saccharimonadales bacterium]